MEKTCGDYGSIKSIRQIDKGFVIECHNSSNKLYISLSDFLSDNNKERAYIASVGSLIKLQESKYEEAKKIVDNNTVAKRCKAILAVSTAVALSMPLLAMLTTSTLLCLLGGAALILYIPSLSYCVGELLHKKDADNMKSQVNQYELLKEEYKSLLEKEIIKELEKRKFSILDADYTKAVEITSQKIKPMIQSDGFGSISQKVKSRVKKPKSNE